MNLRNRIGILPAPLIFQRRRTCFFKTIFGQDAPLRLQSFKPFFMPLMFARRAAVCFCWGLFLMIPAVVFYQTNYYKTKGTE
jgi:hypothetical protein